MAFPVTILLSEDEDDEADLFRFSVKKWRPGVCVERVSDGQAAIEYLVGNGPYSDRTRYPFPDLVVLDLRLPRIDGFQLLRWRNTTPQMAALPFVVLTGSGELLPKCQDLGATSAYLKPMNVDDLRQVIGDICDLASKAPDLFCLSSKLP